MTILYNTYFNKIEEVLKEEVIDCVSLLGLAKRQLPEKVLYDNVKSICELFLCDILNVSRSQIYLENPVLDKKKVEKFKFYLTSLFLGKPVAYILGKVSFFGLEFLLNERCFIPRPETEILVEKAVEAASFLEEKRPLIYDFCAGIGNIGISLTNSLTCCKIIATDLSGESLKFAYENAFLCGAEEKIEFVCCDLACGIKRGREADIIISNPPYINSTDINFLPENVKKEPSLALDGGPDGLDVIRKLFDLAEYYLKTKGFLLFEFGINQSEEINKIAALSGMFKQRQIIKDYSGMNRVFIGRKNS